MKSTIRIGLTIGVLCALWQLVMAATGWIVNPRLWNLFYIVILVEVGVLAWGLKKTAADHSYAGQFLLGTGASVIAATFLFLFSMVLMSYLYPGLMSQMKILQADSLKQAGQSEAQIAAAVSLQTPLYQAAMGFVGTVVTGILATLLIGAFARRKPRASSSPML